MHLGVDRDAALLTRRERRKESAKWRSLRIQRGEAAGEQMKSASARRRRDRGIDCLPGAQKHSTAIAAAVSGMEKSLGKYFVPHQPVFAERLKLAL